MGSEMCIRDRVELVEFSEELSFRQRLLVLQRMRTGDHLPHPFIVVRQVFERVELNAKGFVVIDGCRIGPRMVEFVEPLPDEVIVWAAAPDGVLDTQE